MKKSSGHTTSKIQHALKSVLQYIVDFKIQQNLNNIKNHQHFVMLVILLLTSVDDKIDDDYDGDDDDYDDDDNIDNDCRWW